MPSAHTHHAPLWTQCLRYHIYLLADHPLQEVDVLTPIISGCTTCKTLSNISFKSNLVWSPQHGLVDVIYVQINESHAKWIALLIELETSISCLDLRSNQLGGMVLAFPSVCAHFASDAGGRLIADALAKNKTLEKLVCLSHNSCSVAQPRRCFTITWCKRAARRPCFVSALVPCARVPQTFAGAIGKQHTQLFGHQCESHRWDEICVLMFWFISLC